MEVFKVWLSKSSVGSLVFSYQINIVFEEFEHLVKGDKGAFVVRGICHVGLELGGRLREHVMFEVDVVSEAPQRIE